MDGLNRRVLVGSGLALAVRTEVRPARKRAEPFSRGISIHHALNWAEMDPAGRNYLPRPFGDARHRLDPADLEAIQRSGFDTVRLTIDPGPFLAFTGVQLDDAYAILQQRVEEILSNGLAAIVDFHPNNQNPHFQPTALVRPGSAAFEALKKQIGRTAGLLEQISPERTALELLNEPRLGPSDSADSAWRSMSVQLYRAARGASPRLRIVVSADNGSDPRQLDQLDGNALATDDRVIFTFHYYDPYQFTHQSIPGNSNLHSLGRVPYPASSGSMTSVLDWLSKREMALGTAAPEAQEELRIARGVLAAYERRAFDRSTIERDFAAVGDWAAQLGIPGSRILLGEFGVVNSEALAGPSVADRLRWLHDVRSVAEQHGFAWCIWAYKGGRMALTPEGRSAPDRSVLRALGLAA